MFQVGKQYSFDSAFSGPDGTTIVTSILTVKSIDGTLLELVDKHDRVTIFNTSCITFQQANEFGPFDEDSVFATPKGPEDR